MIHLINLGFAAGTKLVSMCISCLTRCGCSWSVCLLNKVDEPDSGCRRPVNDGAGRYNLRRYTNQGAHSCKVERSPAYFAARSSERLNRALNRSHSVTYRLSGPEVGISVIDTADACGIVARECLDGTLHVVPEIMPIRVDVPQGIVADIDILVQRLGVGDVRVR